MLMRRWEWVLYGSKQVYIIIFSVISTALMIISVTLICPSLKSYQALKYQTEELKQTLSRMQNDIPNHPENNPPIESLSEAFDLTLVQKQHQFYFAGNTEKIIALLCFLLTNSYYLNEFSLEKYQYKTILAVSL